MESDLLRIIEAGVLAPSGDNCQPWAFSVRGETVDIHNLPGMDTSVYNRHQRASLVAHGALIENMAVEAAARGWDCGVSLLPDPGAPDLTARLVFTRDRGRPADPLAPGIPHRCTNRKAYDGRPLTEEQKGSLASQVEPFGPFRLHLLSGAEKDTLAHVISLNDRLVFEWEPLHAFLFDHVRWSADEAERTRDGLDLRTLELSPPDRVAFPLLKRYRLLSLLNHLGVSRIVGGKGGALARSAGAVGLLTIRKPEPSPEEYITAGRAIERVWLDAARLGLSMQLMTGITFLMRLVQEGEAADIGSSRLNLISRAAARIGSIVGPGETPLILFRVGNSPPPSCRSLRRPVRLIS